MRVLVASVLCAGVCGMKFPNATAEWPDFKATYNKVYSDTAEEGRHFKAFKTNLDIIFNNKMHGFSWQLGLNEFADLSPEEVVTHLGGLMKPSNVWGDLPRLGTFKYSGAVLPASVDWTEQGVVTSVKNQGQCGSCWSFSTTGGLEGAWAISTGHLLSLSEQQFVDCDTTDSGCNGGLMDYAFAFAEKNGICTEASYAYTATGGTCLASSCTVGIPKGGVVGFMDVSTEEELSLAEAVAQQPVSVAIEADRSAFQLYKSGVFQQRCGTKLDHGVLAVGYGTDGGVDYWKVKNSWGVSWGEQGYIRLVRGKSTAGECGILSGPPSYPVISGVVASRVL